MDYNDKRLRYIRKYAHTHHPSGFYYEEYYLQGEMKWVPSSLPEDYLSKRDKILEELPFTQEDFGKFDILQNVIKDLNLNPEALFEFIVFLHRAINCWLNNETIFVSNVNEFIKNSINNLEITIHDKSRHEKMTIKDPKILQCILGVFQPNYELKTNLFVTHKKKYKARQANYFLIKILLDNLPIKKDKNIAYSNKERLLSLCVLHLCKFLYGDREYVCDNNNNCTFNQLMRDFEGSDTSLLYLDGYFF